MLTQVLKELVDSESEADQRGRRPDPCHQRPVVSEQRAIHRKLRRSMKGRLARIVIDCHLRILLSRCGPGAPPALQEDASENAQSGSPVRGAKCRGETPERRPRSTLAADRTIEGQPPDRSGP